MTEIILQEDGRSIELHEDRGEFVIDSLGIIATTGALPPVTGNDGYAVIEVGSVAAFRAIKQAYIVPDFAISSFSPDASVVEVGATVATPGFTAAYNRTPDTATLKDGVNPDKDVSSTPTAFSSDETYLKTANNDSQSFTLEATEDGDTDSTGTAISWRPRTMYDVSNDPGPYDEAFIEGLANQQLDNNRATTFTVNAGAGEYIFYCYPDAYGAATFFVGGFEGGFSLVATTSVTNVFGVTQDYRVYKSDNPSLGSTTVTVT